MCIFAANIDVSLRPSSPVDKMDSHKRLNMLEQMLLQQPNDPFLIYGIALEHAALGAHDQAGAHFNTLLTRFPDYLGAYYTYAAWLLARGNEAEAIQILETGITLARKQRDSKTERELNAALLDILDS